MKHTVVRRTLAGVPAALVGASVVLTSSPPALAAVDDRLVVQLRPRRDERLGRRRPLRQRP